MDTERSACHDSSIATRPTGRLKTTEPKPKLLVFVVAYNAEKTISSVLSRIPTSLLERHAVEVLVIDDSSSDQTFELSEAIRRSETLPFPLHVLFNPKNQGYGGNQKIGFHYAIEQGFNFVALIHGDGQYAPECLPDLLKPLEAGQADAVMGSRMLTRGTALRGGMPLYKYIGNKILTAFQNWALRAHLSEFHSGYRVYTVAALQRIPFDLNTNDFHFDTEIIIQLLLSGKRIMELPIPTYYGDEICYVDGLRYARDVALTTLKARAQDLALFYDRKYDCRLSTTDGSRYPPKLGFASPHQFVLDHVPAGAKVLDLGCAGGFVGAALRKRGCFVVGVDVDPLADGIELDEFYQHDLNVTPLPVDVGGFDYVLLLDVLEHLQSPETFVEQLRAAGARARQLELVVSSGNVGFALTRAMLALGQFNYGKRGILDLTHTRLFTVGTLARLFNQAGFEVLESRGMPAPYPLAIGDSWLSHGLLRLNQFLIGISKRLFAYQTVMLVRALPTLDALLQDARTASIERAHRIPVEAA